METTSVWKNKSNEELLLLYEEHKKLEIKQEIVIRYLPILKSIAIQMRNVYLGFTQIDDIVNEGVIAIMNGIDKFEISKGVKFETYISKRIRGLVIDIARKQDWIPRSVKKSVKEVEQATNYLYEKLGYEPSVQQVAQQLGIGVEKYYDIIGKMPLFHILSLDAVLEDSMENKKTLDMSGGTSSVQPEAHILKEEQKHLLQCAINSLKEKEKMVISLYYMEDLHMKEIAGLIQVSEPRVSQIHATAIMKLKSYIEKNN